jgi:hypothetical protein
MIAPLGCLGEQCEHDCLDQPTQANRDRTAQANPQLLGLLSAPCRLSSPGKVLMTLARLGPRRGKLRFPLHRLPLHARSMRQTNPQRLAGGTTTPPLKAPSIALSLARWSGSTYDTPGVSRRPLFPASTGNGGFHRVSTHPFNHEADRAVFGGQWVLLGLCHGPQVLRAQDTAAVGARRLAGRARCRWMSKYRVAVLRISSRH